MFCSIISKHAVTDFGTFKSTMTFSQAGDGYTVAMVDVPQTGPDGQPVAGRRRRFYGA